MDEKIKELADILHKQSEFHKGLIIAAKEMNGYIKTKNLEGIQKVIIKYDHLTGQIEDLEQKRLILCDTIAKKKLKENSHLNIKQLINILENEDEKSILLKKRNNLKEKIDEFSKLNSQNNILLAERIEDIDINIKMIAGHVNKPAAYGNNGIMDNSKINRHMINRVA